MLLARPISEKVFKDSLSCIPGGVNSPVRAFKELAFSPLIVERGQKECVFDVDGHEFIDYCLSWGALILGHAHPSVVLSVQKQMEKGSSFGIATPIEQQMAKRLTSYMPSLEKVRFVSSGTEATMSALRLARGFTGKDRFIKFKGNYHGHADPFLVQAGSFVSFLPQASSLGVPKEAISNTLCLPYNDVEAVKRAFASYKDIGAVIVEPVAANMGLIPASEEFLRTLREETQKAGALLIFDEVVTGFRFRLGGIQDELGIYPDLTTLGKIIGGGLPAAAFGGKREIMDLLAPLGGVYQAGTLSGNPLALTAGLATLNELEKPGFYEELAQKTEFLLAPLEKYVQEKDLPVAIHRKGSCFTLFFGTNTIKSQEDFALLDPALFQAFYRFLFARGIYLAPSQQEVSFVSKVHSLESLQKTRETMLDFFTTSPILRSLI